MWVKDGGRSIGGDQVIEITEGLVKKFSLNYYLILKPCSVLGRGHIIRLSFSKAICRSVEKRQ